MCIPQTPTNRNNMGLNDKSISANISSSTVNTGFTDISGFTDKSVFTEYLDFTDKVNNFPSPRA